MQVRSLVAAEAGRTSPGDKPLQASCPPQLLQKSPVTETAGAATGLQGPRGVVGRAGVPSSATSWCSTNYIRISHVTRSFPDLGHVSHARIISDYSDTQ